MAVKYKFTVKLLVLLVTAFISLKVVDLFLGPPPVPHPAPYAFSDGTGRFVVLREIRPQLDTTVEPSPSSISGSDHLDPSPRRLQTDANGFVVGSSGFRPEKRESADIIFFGGSTTECLYADADNRFPALVQQFLLNEEGANAVALNAGVSGSHTVHMLISLIAKGIPERPRVAVLMESINDLVTLTRSGTYWEGPPSRQIIQRAALQPDPRTKRFQRWIQATAHLLFNNLAERAILAFPNISRIIDPDRAEKASDDEWQSLRDAKPADHFQIASDFKSSLLSFIRVARSWNITPVLMTQFNRLTSDDEFIRNSYGENNADYDDFCLRYSEFNEIIRKTAQEEGCLLIDLDKKVRPAKDFLYDSVHLNKDGCILVAAEVASALAKAIPGFGLSGDFTGSQKADINKEKP